MAGNMFTSAAAWVESRDFAPLSDGGTPTFVDQTPRKATTSRIPADMHHVVLRAIADVDADQVVATVETVTGENI